MDLERYLSSRRSVLNAGGGRGYDHGVRTFNCPFCGDARGRGWMHVQAWAAGCFNVGCVAYERLAGGALEWVERVERTTRRGAWGLLLTEFLGAGSARAPRPPPRGPDWVTWPREVRWLTGARADSALWASVAAFLLGRWGLSWEDAGAWGLGYCWDGRYARRVIIPVLMPGPVAFQARATLPGQEPKYRTSSSGECGRPGSALLHNYRPALRGVEVLLVEGAADVMRWHRGDPTLQRRPLGVALLGTALTAEKLALLAALEPVRVIVALDAEPAAQARGRLYAEDLGAWGLTVELGTWTGGKDAGAGAGLARRPSGSGPQALVRDLLGT